MFQEVAGQASFPDQEEKILRFWKENRIYEKSLEQRADSPKFVFYEGPPTANGMPHPGHCLTRAIKDVFPRYKTMRGYLCQRKAGWDTHGLPVEVEVCKELGIHSKEQIESYGVEPFIQKCQQSVWRYMKEWERLTERLGFWVNLDEAYVTYHQSYVESVWWSLKNFFDRGLLYQGHKIVWWWAQGGTALSSGEVGQGYREVADPSVFVKFPLVEDPSTSLLVWTTTPWTLPSNQWAAVHPELEYSTVRLPDSDEHLILASDLVESISAKSKTDFTVVATCTGTQLIGKRYIPPFDYFYKELGNQTGNLKDGGTDALGWRVLSADFVTVSSGTGLVHQAPAFGEVDYEVLIQDQSRFEEGQGPQMICAVGPDGKFTDQIQDYAGQWVKDADKQIQRDLKAKGLLFHQEQYLHDYPFCWRSDQDPLIQYPRKSWFVRTTQFREKLLENNKKINWLPDHIQTGRFGNFLESNVDWALSRERYWGTPLPIWVCEESGRQEAVSSYAELLTKPGIQGQEFWEKTKAENPDLPDDLKVHKPYIDAVTYASPFCEGARMKRVPEVIDCWYDSGAMPFAQWGYPHQNADLFAEQFPADFISEAIDQTRGWFYSLLAISTLLFSEENPSGGDEGDSSQSYPHPYRTCIVLGLMLSEWWEQKAKHLAEGERPELFMIEEEAQKSLGQGNYDHHVGKMSKQKRNYSEPSSIFDTYGADVLRWYFFANQPPWTSIRYSEQQIRDSIPEFLLRLWHVYGFFVNYARLDGFDPGEFLANKKEGLSAPSNLDPEDFENAKGFRPVSQRSQLDRWVVSELNRCVETVVQSMDQYDNYVACQTLNEFVDGLSNWFVRRSRDRFWSKDKTAQDKHDAYWTLYECLLTTAKMIAPFTPFMADEIWHNLSEGFQGVAVPSVHLCDYPTVNDEKVDSELSDRMSVLREIASLGRSARMESKLKVRQPLAGVEVILSDSCHQQWLEQNSEILKEELNVKEIEFKNNADEYITYQIQPNFKRLGQRIRHLMPKVKIKLADADGGELLKQLESAGKVTLDVDGESVELDNEDIQVRLQAKEGWSAAQGRFCVVVLSTELSDELIREGYARDIIRFVQDLRKETQLEFNDQIDLFLVVDEGPIRQAIRENMAYIKSEVQAQTLAFDATEDSARTLRQVGEFEVEIGLSKA
ncbi:isoleucine--tRNA ligase [Mariniblastus sp.]|nr:isoleucine--tRNA ligase [Mariniblastus sp.]MDB4756783.1 isoleucine--tRNA ligase [Mariniblastus sp.]